MNKYILYKTILAFLLLQPISFLHCMEASNAKNILNGREQNDLKQEIYISDPLGLECIKSEIINSKNLFNTAEWILSYIDFVILREDRLHIIQGLNLDEIRTFLMKKCAKWLAEKIVQDKLETFQKTDLISLLFDKGINIVEKIQHSKNDITNAPEDESKPCPLADLPNELLQEIFMQGVNAFFDNVQPIDLDIISKCCEFSHYLSMVYGDKEKSVEANKRKKIQKALNNQLSLCNCEAIKFIINVMQINKISYLFCSKLVNQLKNKIFKELIHEKLMCTHQDSYSLMSLLLSADTFDANYNFKRVGKPCLNFLTIALIDANTKYENHENDSRERNIIQKLILHGANLQSYQSPSTILVYPVVNQNEDLAIFLIQIAPNIAKDKASLHYALIYDMQRLIKAMLANGMAINKSDIKKAQVHKKKIDKENNSLEDTHHSGCLGLSNLQKCIIS